MGAMTPDKRRKIVYDYVREMVEKSKGNSKLAHAPSWVKKASEQDGLIILDTGCDCMGENHDLSIGVEIDRDLDQPAISWWSDLACYLDTYDAWHYAFERRRSAKGEIPKGWLDETIIWFTKWPQWFSIMYDRFKAACKIFFTGYYEFHGGTTFKGEEHIQDVMIAMWWAMDEVRRNKERKRGIRRRGEAKKRVLNPVIPEVTTTSTQSQYPEGYVTVFNVVNDTGVNNVTNVRNEEFTPEERTERGDD